METAVEFGEPMPLKYGKKANCVAGASLGSWRTLRQRGHAGIANEVYALDGCYWDRITLILLHHHHELAPGIGAPGTLRSPEILRDLEWVSAVRCALHAVQLCLRKALEEYFNQTELLKNQHISIRSMVNGSDLVLRFIGSWIACRARYCPEL